MKRILVGAMNHESNSFNPIIAGEEEKSWEKFYNESLDIFFDGKYEGEYEKALIDAFYKKFE